MQYPDICWANAPAWEDLDDLFPSAALHFDGGATLLLRPFRYLYLLKPGTYCFGVFDNNWDGVLIGGIAVRNVLVQVRICWAGLRGWQTEWWLVARP